MGNRMISKYLPTKYQILINFKGRAWQMPPHQWTSSVRDRLDLTCHLIEGSEKDIHNITSTLVLPNIQTLINPNCGTFYKSGLFRSQVSRLQRSRTGWGMSQTGGDQVQRVILNWILLCKGHPWDRQWKCPGWDLMVMMWSILISWFSWW